MISKNGKAFISYRRSDSAAITGRIHDSLRDYFGPESLFLDFDSIEYGVDYREKISSAISECSVLICIIGPKWMGRRLLWKSRLYDKNDPVRVEVETAVNHNIPILPVLVLGSPMPTAERLPELIQTLAFSNAITVDTDRDFHVHMARLKESLEQQFGLSAIATVDGSIESGQNNDLNALNLSFIRDLLVEIRKKDLAKEQSRTGEVVDKYFKLYSVLREVGAISESLIEELSCKLQAMKAGEDVAAKQSGRLSEHSKHMMDKLDEMVQAVDSVNPQLEIYQNDLVNRIFVYRQLRRVTLSDLEQSVLATEEASMDDVEGILASAIENKKFIDQAIQDMRGFLRNEFSFKETLNTLK